MLYRLPNILAFAILTFVAALFLGAPGASAEDAHLKFGRPANHPNILVMIWQGKIAAPMADEIKAAFEKNKDGTRTVELKLNSAGGSVVEGERVIAVLQNIKTTHKLVTSVAAGRQCGSMCVFIYVQGERRLAASASLWLFHEVSMKDRKTQKTVSLDRARWEQLVDKYWVPAGVDQKWIDGVKTHTVGSDYWQSGDSLLRDGANIIQKALPDENRRMVGSSGPVVTSSDKTLPDEKPHKIASTASADSPRDPDTPGEICHKYSAEMASMVETACQ